MADFFWFGRIDFRRRVAFVRLLSCFRLGRRVRLGINMVSVKSCGFEAFIPARAGEPRNPCSGHVTHTVYPPHCLKSNVTELRSHKASWQIRPRNARWLASVVGKTRRNASANLFWAFVMSALHLIDTRRGSPKGHYVKRPPRSAPQPWPDIPQALNTLGFGAHPRGVRLPRCWWPFGAFPPTTIDLIQSTRASE